MKMVAKYFKNATIYSILYVIRGIIGGLYILFYILRTIYYLMKNNKNKQKKTIDKYNPVIYPRLLWVAKNVSEADINKRFVGIGGETITFDQNKYSAIVWRVFEKKTEMLGELVILGEDLVKQMDIVTQSGMCTHEAIHVAFDIFEDIGIKPGESQEASAYFVQWAESCIIQTLLKK